MKLSIKKFFEKIYLQYLTELSFEIRNLTLLNNLKRLRLKTIVLFGSKTTKNMQTRIITL